jgi:hypothetical protein
MKWLAMAGAACLLASSTASAEVQVSMHDGLVTVIAKDATVRQIVAEWARVGQAKVVNAERIPGGPVTLELVDVPEAQVLDTLLRSAAGYLAAPRAVLASNLSRYDRVVVMPTSSAPRAAASAPAPTFQQPQFPQPPNDDEPEEARPNPNGVPPNPNMPFPNPRGAAFNNFPQQQPQPQVVPPQPQVPQVPFGVPGQVPGQVPPAQQPANGQQPVTYPATPFVPAGGVSVPGMVAPAPQPQPGQVVQPGQQIQPGQPLQPGQQIQPGQIVPPQPGQPRRPDGK